MYSLAVKAFHTLNLTLQSTYSRFPTHWTVNLFIKFYSSGNFSHYRTVTVNNKLLYRCRLSTHWTVIVFNKFYSSGDFSHVHWTVIVFNNFYRQQCRLTTHWTVIPFNTLAVRLSTHRTFNVLRQFLWQCRLSEYWPVIIYVQQILQQYRFSTYWTVIVCNKFYSSVNYQTLDSHCLQLLLQQCRLSTHWTVMHGTKSNHNKLCKQKWSTAVQTFHALPCQCCKQCRNGSSS